MSANVSTFYQNHIGKGVPGSEIYRLDRQSGTPMLDDPKYLTGTMVSGTSTGVCLFAKSDGTYDVCDPSNPAKMPAVCYLEETTSATSFAGRPLGATGEIQTSGRTVGAQYVVGSDGKPAALGDSNYPASGSQIQPIGFAVSATTIIIAPGMPASGSGAALGGFVMAAPAADVTNTTTETNIAQIAVPAGALNKVGRKLVFSGVITHSGTNAGDKIQVRVRLASTAGTLLLDTGLVAPTTGGDTTLFSGSIDVTAIGTGTAAKENGYGSLVCANGTITGNQNQVGFDSTIAQTLFVDLKWNNANNANHAVFQSLTMQYQG